MFRIDGNRINLLRFYNNCIILHMLLLILKSITFHCNLHLTDFFKKRN